MNKNRAIFLFVFVLIFMGAFGFFLKKEEGVQKSVTNENMEPSSEQLERNEDVVIKQEKQETEKSKIVSEKETKIPVKLEVPFVLQAPFGNWSDPLFEDACEEAAVLMAAGWLSGKGFTSEQAYDEIKKIASIEDNLLKEHIDASASDTAKVFVKYSAHENIKVMNGIALDDIILQISQGNLVIVPTNGRKLGNPFYTAPGPITHMIVIIGYDEKKKEFIVNDSGTKHGKDYRYDEKVLFEAIRDYPTGNHYKKPIDEKNISKVMLVVKKNS